MSSPNILCNTHPKKFLKVQLRKFHVTLRNHRGNNQLYQGKCAKCFLFEQDFQSSNTNELSVRIHTNDYSFNSAPKSYPSTSHHPNTRFLISKQLEHFCTLQKVIPRQIQRKYFNLIRNKLLDRINLIQQHGTSNPKSNRHMNTFLIFHTNDGYRFHFGIYVLCRFITNFSSPDYDVTSKIHCLTPCSFMMSS